MARPRENHEPQKTSAVHHARTGELTVPQPPSNTPARTASILPSALRRLEAGGIVLTLAAIAALYHVPQVPGMLLAFVGLAILPGLYLGRQPLPPGYRRAWNWAVIVFIVVSLTGQLILALPAHTVLVLICLFLLLQRWYTGRGRKEYVEIWCLTALMMLVASLGEPGAAGLALLLVWCAAAMPFMSALAVNAMAAGHGPGRRNWAGLEHFSPMRPWLIAPVVGGLALLVFLAIPRTHILEPASRELLLPSQPARAMLETGFSGKVHLQGMTMLRETEGVALKLTVPPAFHGAERLRLRVHPLDLFDGEVWRRAPSGEGHAAAPRSLLPPDYAIARDSSTRTEGAHDLLTIRPIDFPGPALPLPESTTAFQSPPRGASLMLHPGGTVEAGILRTASEYGVLSLRGPIRRPDGPLLRGEPRPEHLEVPAALAPAVHELAGRILPPGGEYGGPVETAGVVEKYFRRNGRYSLDLTHLDNTSAVLEQFMTGSLRGHCELFASAMAIVLREQGIPARLAVGFSGSDPRGTSGQDSVHLVRHRHAHAWVEVHDGEDGWVPFDPTPSPLYAALPAWASTAEAAWLLGHPLRHALQLMESYDLQMQSDLLRQVRERGYETLEEWENGALLRAGKRVRRNATEPPLLVLAALLLALNAVAIYAHRRWSLRRVGSRAGHTAAAALPGGEPGIPRLFLRLLRELESEGGLPPPGMSPGEAIRHAAGRRGLDRGTASELARLYTEWRFRRRTSASERAIRALLRRVRQGRSGTA